MKRITPLVKGLITGIIMVAITLISTYVPHAPSTLLRILFFAIYAAGLVWTLLAYSRSPNFVPEFGAIFGQGFRCFIVVTLLVVTFTGIFAATHPEDADQMGKQYREELQKQGNRAQPEMDKMVAEFKKHYVSGNISIAIFGSLITGAIFTAAGAGLLLIRRK